MPESWFLLSFPTGENGVGPDPTLSGVRSHHSLKRELGSSTLPRPTFSTIREPLELTA
jgi:hypothetical protein